MSSPSISNLDIFATIYDTVLVEEFKVSLPYPIPSKKNNRINFVTPSGKQCSLPSKQYQKWNERTKNLLVPTRPRKPISKAACIVISFFFKNKQRRDLTNITDSIMDTLVDAKIISDDNWQVTGDLLLFVKNSDKQNPRAEISIFYKEKSDET